MVFKDGSEEEIDLIMLANGYEYKMPFFDASMFEWKDGRPQLYLNVIHRSKRVFTSSASRNSPTPPIAVSMKWRN